MMPEFNSASANLPVSQFDHIDTVDLYDVASKINTPSELRTLERIAYRRGLAGDYEADSLLVCIGVRINELDRQERTIAILEASIHNEPNAALESLEALFKQQEQ